MYRNLEGRSECREETDRKGMGKQGCGKELGEDIREGRIQTTRYEHVWKCHKEMH